MTEQKFLTVTALTRYLKRKFDTDPHLQEVWIKGELSNFKWHSRGHMYFTLKDENARIQAVMFASDNRYIKFKPEDGMKVLIRGEVTIYESYGQYQIYVKEMQPDGIGSLYLAYEELKKKLETEGLFSQDRKKPIPKYPEHIGVITSPTGAAIRDILTTIKRRYPIAQVTIFPVLVQGDHAALSIVKAIERANLIGGFDVLISGRGGGSIEDLWPFNEEIVARAIFSSQIPIISAVGHETDYTISDFVADMRAPTPTGAAELAVPHIEELLDRVQTRRIRLVRAMKETIKNEKKHLLHLYKSYAFRYPKQLLNQKEQELDRMFERLNKESGHYIDTRKDKWTQMNRRLKQVHPFAQIARATEQFDRTMHEFERAMNMIMNEKRIKMSTVLTKLNALNPLSVMERGYSIVYTDEKKLVKSVNQIQLGEMIKVQLIDGQLDCQVWGMEESQQNE
ncbi:exodeoxyribonuclease VII large subunit [Calidifontibacillus oryziterrae]|uniref:exodeoxyribonuclease VII large subunit n=1 Tax=Calidifontibacillus oryziterrae TaxID=1191699 RepID=UPI0002F2E971|nr:exodeoxyribonuclease VII large subunit [Calidifontibacillus oryziterrae]